LARDHPATFEAYGRREFASVRAAAMSVGLIKEGSLRKTSANLQKTFVMTLAEIQNFESRNAIQGSDFFTR